MDNNYYSRNTDHQDRRAMLEGNNNTSRYVHEYGRNDNTRDPGYTFKSFSEMTLDDSHRQNIREYSNYPYESRNHAVNSREESKYFRDITRNSYPIPTPASHHHSANHHHHYASHHHSNSLSQHVYSKSLGSNPNPASDFLFKRKVFSPEGQSDNDEPSTNIPNTPPPSSEGSPNYYSSQMYENSPMLSTSFPNAGGSFQFIDDKNVKPTISKNGQSRSENWSYEETNAFIEVLLSLQQQFQKIRQYPKLWVKISQAMASKGYNRSVINCRNRWKVLVTKYRKAYAESVDGKRIENSKNFEFFEVVGNLLAPNYSCQEDGQIIRAFKNKVKTAELKKINM